MATEHGVGAMKRGGAQAGKHKRKGAMKRTRQKRVGRPVSLQPIDLSTPAKSAAAQEANARSAMASGRVERNAAAVNVEAFKAIAAICALHAAAVAARGLVVVVVQGAALLCERLSVIVEVEALGAASPPEGELLDTMAFLSKRRAALGRLMPGPSRAAERAQFGLHQQLHAAERASLLRAAQMILAGRKANPHSRAAQLITADDERRLQAIVKAISAAIAAKKKARAASVSRTTERDILNCAVEMFYDDYAASIGLALEGDELARVRALSLVPRRPERRAEGAGASGGSSGANAGTTGSTGAQAQAGAGVAASGEVGASGAARVTAAANAQLAPG